MRILGFKEGHDGSIVLIENGELIFQLEPEKDSFPRCADVTAELYQRAANLSSGPPDVVAIGGWTKGKYSSDLQSTSGYFGAGTSHIRDEATMFYGHPVRLFSSSHERSHIWCGYGMSPFPQGQRCHALVWEGNIGNFYTVTEQCEIVDHARVMTDPGNKYTFLYSLADPNSPSVRGFWDTSHPGKMMALAAYGTRGPLSEEESTLIDFVVARSPIMTTTSKNELRWSPFYNIGVETQAFKDLSAKFTERIFNTFQTYAKNNLEPGLPFIVSGGCGLNCEWNSRWRESEIFSEVFVPPCCNDSGSALGTAIDAQRHFTGEAKITWKPDSGEYFIHDAEMPGDQYVELPYDPTYLAVQLSSGAIIAWAEGRYEMGPRALGRRSILAEPFNESTRDRLNQIKRREKYRPIAPVCLELDISLHFEPSHPSPHMLYFHHVHDQRLKAITHVDGTARIQSISTQDESQLADLLRAFRTATGVGVLCNTSLNFNGRGFINRVSDLAKYCASTKIDIIVIDGRVYKNLNSPSK